MQKKIVKSTIRVRRLRQRRKRLQELAKEKADWLLWAVRKFWSERDIEPTTYVPIHEVRTGLITEKDFSLSDFFNNDSKLLAALNTQDVDIAQVYEDSVIIRPKFL